MLVWKEVFLIVWISINCSGFIIITTQKIIRARNSIRLNDPSDFLGLLIQHLSSTILDSKNIFKEIESLILIIKSRQP
jgi:hypothetical protein